MDICKVEYCGRVANLDQLCLLHRRKEVAGQLEHEDGKVWDTCAQGHRWTLENTHIESNSKGGKRRRCKRCLAERAERKRNEAPVVETPQAVRLETPALRAAHATADRAQAALTAKCKGSPADYTDYTAANIPSDVEAAKLCSGCPLLQACANKAAAERPGWGVWGGQVWVYGEPYAGDRSRLHADD